MNLAALIIAGALVMPQPWGTLVRRDHIMVVGSPGCGKTPFAAELADSARRVVYFDPTGEWAEHGEQVPAALIGEAEFVGTFLSLVVVPEEETLHDDFRATVAACRAAAPHGGLVLLIDEVGDLVPECTAELQGLHRNGHKDGVATVMCSPCATDIPKRCRDTASRVFSFFQKSAADRRALADEYGETFAARAAGWRYPEPPAAWVSPTLHT